MAINEQDIKESLAELDVRVRLIEITCARIEENTRRHTEDDRAMLLKVNTLLERYDLIIFGNSSPGLKTRLDRIEEKERIRQWNLRALWATLLALLSKIIYDLFSSMR